MYITLNGQKKELLPSQNLQEVIGRFASGPAVVVVEVNGTIIKKNQWDAVSVNDGDTIELVSFVGGG